MTNKKLKGMPLDTISSQFDACMKACNEALKENPELVIMYDLESGYPYTATKESRDSFLAMLEAFTSKSNFKPKGKIMFYGTGGQMEKNNDYYKFWEQNE